MRPEELGRLIAALNGIENALWWMFALGIVAFLSVCNSVEFIAKAIRERSEG